MTTQHHAPIVSGESNSPSTVNTRLSALDSGIVSVEDALDTLIIQSGTSDAEVIAARTAINYAAGTPPASLSAALDLAAGNFFNVEAYGAAPGNTAAANTTAINAAIAAATGGVVWFPGNGQTYNVNEITIANSCRIVGNGNLLQSAGSAIFAVTTAIDWLIIEGFTFDWNVTKSVESLRDAFTNGNLRGSTSYSSIIYAVNHLVIQHCHFRGSRVYIYGAGNHIVQHNTWGAATPATDLWHNPALYIEGTGPRVLHNRFDCYCPTGLNKDVLKVASNSITKYAQVVGNYIRNGNGAAQAQLDYYDGGNRILVDGNTFVNVQIGRKEVGSGPTVITIDFDKIINNHFEIEGSVTYPEDFIDFNGSFCLIRGNSFSGDGVAGKTCITWQQKEFTQHELGTKWPIGVIISENMSRNVDLFVECNASDAEVQGRSIISNNLVWDASYLIRVYGANPDPTQLAVIGNYWFPNATPANQVAMLDGAGTIALGNVVDETLGTFKPAADLGGLVTGTRYRSNPGGGLSVNDDAVAAIPNLTDRGLILVWTGSAESEAALFAYRITATFNHCGVMAQQSTIMEAVAGTGVPTSANATDTKIALFASTNGTLYVINRRGAARSVYWMAFCGA